MRDEGAVGAWAKGYRPSKLLKAIRFQNSLNEITPAKFERLAAVVLKMAKNMFNAKL